MKAMISLRNMLLIVLPVGLGSCNGQENNSVLTQRPAASQVVGGPFENGDYMFEGIPQRISSIDTSPGWGQSGQQLLITGTIYHLDGKTPAADVILYYYHTNIEGKYIHKPGEKRTMAPNPLGQTHGYIRGWIKTSKNGQYSIYTVRPGTYPSRAEPAHIHLSIQEPGLKDPYYIDEFVFDDDELLTTTKRKRLENRGGSGILRVLQKDDLQIAEHNIILGLTIPYYPTTNDTRAQSGLSVGEDQPSFTPFHAYGPDRGSRACPVCKYGRYHGIIYFVGNRGDWSEVKRWLTFLEQQSVVRGRYLKVYFVYGNDLTHDQRTRQQELETLGTNLKINHLALTFVPSFSDRASEAYLNKINPGVENTFIVFRNRAIIDKFVDFRPTKENFQLLATLLDQTKGAYFNLPEPVQK